MGLDFKRLCSLINEETFSRPDWDTLRYRFSEENHSFRLDFSDKSGTVGFIVWDPEDGEVERLYVGDQMRRKGLGTYMWETATEFAEEKNVNPPEHSSRRTYEGDQFAKSIGGYIPSLTDDIDGWYNK